MLDDTPLLLSSAVDFLVGRLSQETEYKGVLARVEAFAEEEGRRPRILVRVKQGRVCGVVLVPPVYLTLVFVTFTRTIADFTHHAHR